MIIISIVQTIQIFLFLIKILFLEKVYNKDKH